MKTKWYKSEFIKQIVAGVIVLVVWAIITCIYSFVKNINFLESTLYLWNKFNFPIGLGELVCILIIYTLILKALSLRKQYLTKKEITERLSEKVNCSSCNTSWDVLFAQISPYHPMHSYYTSDDYYLNQFRNLIWFGLRKKPNPDYYDIGHGIDGLIEVIKHKQHISDTERDEILEVLNDCDDNKIKSKKEKLLELINKYHT